MLSSCCCFDCLTRGCTSRSVVPEMKTFRKRIGWGCSLSRVCNSLYKSPPTLWDMVHLITVGKCEMLPLLPPDLLHLLTKSCMLSSTVQLLVFERSLISTITRQHFVTFAAFQLLRCILIILIKESLSIGSSYWL